MIVTWSRHQDVKVTINVDILFLDHKVCFGAQNRCLETCRCSEAVLGRRLYLIPLMHTFVQVIVLPPSLEKKTYSIKRQWYKENPFLFKINNASMFSELKRNQSTYSTFTRSDSLLNEVIKAAIQQLSCYALVSLSSLFNMHVTTHGAPNQTNTKAICYPERRIAITISATSHWFTHLFFCRGTGMENSLISM